MAPNSTINKETSISLGLLLVVCTFILAGFGWSSAVSEKASINESKINKLEKELAETNLRLQKQWELIGELRSDLTDEINKPRPDAWSGTMEIISNQMWRDLNPELHLVSPDVRKIQNEYPLR